jgi:hypothetical protein
MRKILLMTLVSALVSGGVISTLVIALPTCDLCEITCGSNCVEGDYTDEYAYICGIGPAGLDLICHEYCRELHDCLPGGYCLLRIWVDNTCDEDPHC